MDLFKPAIVVVGYNRPISMKRLLDSIGMAKFGDQDVTLIISIDKSDRTSEVIKVAESFPWRNGKKIIRTFKTRQGLRNHILQCGDLSIEYGSVIILEDDLIVSPIFYIYAKAALNYYQDDEKIAGIALYSHQWNGYASRFFSPIYKDSDVYFGQFSITWGQCWSENHWKMFKSWYENNEGKLKFNDEIPNQITNWSGNSWGKYFVYYIVEKSKYYVIPYIALTTNFTDVGQHAKNADSAHQVPILCGERKFKFSSYENSIKYDIFFERKDMEQYFSAEIMKDGVCIDLYATKKGYGNKRYLLTTSLKPYKIIKTYGLQMRPHEMNVIFNIPGNDIFLYDMRYRREKNFKGNKTNYHIYKYDLRGFTWRQILPYAIVVFLTSLKRKMFKK